MKMFVNRLQEVLGRDTPSFIWASHVLQATQHPESVGFRIELQEMMAFARTAELRRYQVTDKTQRVLLWCGLPRGATAALLQRGVDFFADLGREHVTCFDNPSGGAQCMDVSSASSASASGLLLLVETVLPDGSGPQLDIWCVVIAAHDRIMLTCNFGSSRTAGQIQPDESCATDSFDETHPLDPTMASGVMVYASPPTVTDQGGDSPRFNEYRVLDVSQCCVRFILQVQCVFL